MVIMRMKSNRGFLVGRASQRQESESESGRVQSYKGLVLA